MNMLYEGLKEKGALMLVPSSAVESMGMGGLMGAAALRQQTLTGTPETPDTAKNERTVMDRTTPDRLNGRVMLLLVLVGAALAFVGWYRFFAG